MNGGVGSIAQDSVLNVDACEFLQNSANIAGVFQVSIGASATLSHSNFTENRVTWSSGVVLAQDERTEVKILNCIFTRNFAPHAGVLYVQYGARYFSSPLLFAFTLANARTFFFNYFLLQQN